MRASGLLMHISSLPSEFGIGTFGQAAFQFIDFLAESGQRYWQILPIGPTGYGDSPYQSFSTFAGNPYLIDLDLLEQDGLLEREDYCHLDWGKDPARVDYERIYRNRFAVLRKAFSNGRLRDREPAAQFRAQEKQWIEDYALFMALKNFFAGKAWNEWDSDIKLRDQTAVERYQKQLESEVDFWVYLQYMFYRQYFALKSYANQKGVQMIGDIPIYVAADSADVWANPKLFWLDEQHEPIFIAGVPPDYFAPEGQLWGNPLYDWKQHRESGYSWWIERVRAATTVYDMVRIDHFRGFAGFYAVPYGDTDATGGHWEKGPGIEVFEAIRSALGECSIIAEDLGVLTEDVRSLLEQSGFPGMKVLQFAFDGDWNNAYLPHNHIQNCVVYTGTHDNDTLMHWWHTALSDADRQHAADYLRLSEEEGIHWGLLRAAWASVAALTIAPVQDLLGLDGSSRMNHPSTLGGNWQFRVLPNQLTELLAKKLERLSGLYQRSTRFN